jgi:hypothetical protein
MTPIPARNLVYADVRDCTTDLDDLDALLAALTPAAQRAQRS